MLNLRTITGPLSSVSIILIECGILLAVTLANIVGVKFSGKLETVLAAIKIVPLLILPIIFFMFFDPSHFKFSSAVFNGDAILSISQTALLTFWGFIGLESATTPAERVSDPKKTIPRAIIIGTACVAFVYIINTVSIIGVVGFSSLANSSAPYAVVIEKIFGNFSAIGISIMAIIVCVGTLNAWTLTGSQIAYGAYNDGLFPRLFGKTNKAGAPITALVISAVGMLPFMIIEQMDCWRPLT